MTWSNLTTTKVKLLWLVPRRHLDDLRMALSDKMVLSATLQENMLNYTMWASKIALSWFLTTISLVLMLGKKNIDGVINQLIVFWGLHIVVFIIEVTSLGISALLDKSIIQISGSLSFGQFERPTPGWYAERRWLVIDSCDSAERLGSCRARIGSNSLANQAHETFHSW